MLGVREHVDGRDALDAIAVSAKNREVTGLGDHVATHIDDARGARLRGGVEELGRGAGAGRVEDDGVKGGCALMLGGRGEPCRRVSGYEAATVSKAIGPRVALCRSDGVLDALDARDLHVCAFLGSRMSSADADGARTAVGVEQ